MADDRDWPDFDFAALPDVGELRKGRAVMMVDREKGRYRLEGGEVVTLPRVKQENRDG